MTTDRSVNPPTMMKRTRTIGLVVGALTALVVWASLMLHPFLKARPDAERARRKAQRNRIALLVERSKRVRLQQKRMAEEERKRLESAAEGETRDRMVLDLGDGEKLELIRIPAGSFRMGSTPEQRLWATGPEGGAEVEKIENEGDQPREARIDHDFWIGRTEVTVGQWKRFMAANPTHKTQAERDGEAYCFDWQGGNRWKRMRGKSWKDPGFEQEDDHPVVCVSWYDIRDFCAWLKRRYADRLPAGTKFRLPGEGEWEYACRGGRTNMSLFWWGDGLLDGKGRMNGRGQDPFPDGSMWKQPWLGWSDGYACTSPVDLFGSRGRNGFGLADMVGNVLERCEDDYVDKEGASATIRKVVSARCVIRGGGFSSEMAFLRCASRDQSSKYGTEANIGFRVCVGPPAP